MLGTHKPVNFKSVQLAEKVSVTKLALGHVILMKFFLIPCLRETLGIIYSEFKYAPVAPTAVGPSFSYLSERAEKNTFPAVMGIIRYNDVFPKIDRHITKYCFLITAVKYGDTEPIAYPIQCRHWNCADDECRIDKERYQKEVAGPNAK